MSNCILVREYRGEYLVTMEFPSDETDWTDPVRYASDLAERPEATEFDNADDAETYVDFLLRYTGPSTVSWVTVTDDDTWWARQEPTPENTWVLPAEQFDALVDKLERPPAPTRRLKKLLRTKPVWDTDQ